MRENHRRSIAKAVSYRLFAVAITTAIVFVFTKNVRISFGIGLFELIAKSFFYYVHERIWNKTLWGT